MIKTTLKKSLLIIALAILPMTFFGQEKNPTNFWFFGIEGGPTTMFADNQPFKLDQTSWNAGASLGYVLKNTIYMYGYLGYVDLKGKYDNFFTIEECNLFQANINLGYDVLQLFKFKPDRWISIIPHFGIGTINHKSKTKFESGKVIINGYDEKAAIQGNGIAKRKNVYQNIFGMNFLFNITKNFGANIDFVALKTDTEGLDNFRSGRHSDWYAYANIGLQFRFGHKEVKPCPDCPECEPTAPDCESCKDVIQQAVKDAVEEAMKNAPKNQNAMEGEEDEADDAESLDSMEEVEIGDINVKFKVNKAVVEKTPAHEAQAQKIQDYIDAGRNVNTVKAVGYASPEGNDKSNEKLAADRAQATANYIQNKLGDDAKGIEFLSEGKGSDWDGFFKALADSDIAAKEDIANTIKNSENPTATLNEMRNKYPELNKILDTLRVTRVYINK